MIPGSRFHNQAIRERRLHFWGLVEGPRVGDVVLMPDGEVRRVSYHWGDSIQTSRTGLGGSFYLGDGYVSYSGGLEHGIPAECFEDAGETREARFWHFDNDWAGAGRGIDFVAPVRVFRVTATE